MSDPIMNAEQLIADVTAPSPPASALRSMYQRQRQLIIDNMPSGTHRMRALLWRRLAARCLEAADKHEAVADRRENTARVVRSFAPAFRQTALEAILRGELSIEMDQPLAEAVPPVEGWIGAAPGDAFADLGAESSDTHAHLVLVDGTRGRPWGDPENGTWRPLTATERNTYTIRRRSGWDHTTGDEQRDGRTREPPAWYFESESEIEES